MTSAAGAETIVLDFDEVYREGAGVYHWGPTFQEDGFTLTARHPVPGNVERFVSVGADHYLFADSASLFNGGAGGETTLTRDGALPFDLQSIDLAQLPNGTMEGDPIDGGPFDVTLYATQVDGTELIQTVHVETLLTLRTFTFAGFTDLASLRWYQYGGTPGAPLHQFDNIRLSVGDDLPAPVPIPSPAIAGLVLLGCVGAVRCRRRFWQA